nr:hypothetical protein [Tanacetum cinerariifolium]
DVLKNQATTFEMNNKELNEQLKELIEKNNDLLAQTKNVILEKIIIDLEDKVVNLLEKEKANLKTIESLKSEGFESSENVIFESENQSENDCHVYEKECDKVKNSKIVHIYLWIIDSECSKHMMGNHALLTNFVEKFLKTVRFGNNDFAVIAGHGDVVIGSMMIKKVYYAEGLGHNLFSVGQFCDKGLEVTFRKCYLLNDYVDVGKLKANGDTGVFVGYSKEFAAFRIYNNQTRKIHESVNVNFEEISEMASKQFSLEPSLSNLNKTEKSSNPSVSKVSEASKKDFEDLFQKFYDEYFDSSKIMKSSTTNVETSINQEVFHDVSELHQGESSSSSLNDDVQQSPEEDAYFDASTSFHDPSNVRTYYQPYLHEKKWTKDHPLHKIIGDPKSSVRTKGQLANSCLFSCLLSSIEPANVAEALKDTDWVSAIQEELDQFARLKVWRLEEVYVGQPPGFVSKQYPDHVYALDKALYGLKQALRVWYDVLLQFLIESGFQKGSIDTTLFIKKKVPTPMVEQAKLKLDLVEKPVDHTDYQNADHAGCHLDRKSTSGSVQFLGDKLVCWSSKKQNWVSISTAESEYVAVSS